MIKNHFLVTVLSLALFLSFGFFGTSYAYENYQSGDRVIVTAVKTPAYATPSISTTVVGYAYRGMVLTVLGQSGASLKVKSSYGKIGYNHVNTVKKYGSTAPQTTQMPSSSDLGDRVVSAALKYLGVPYKLGGDYDLDGTYAFDCSGFVKRAYADVGVKLPRTATQQWNQTKGNQVTLDTAKKGDLVFFDLNQNGSIDHDGIYIGNHQVIHASTANGGKVQVTDLSKSAWWKSRVLYLTRVAQ